MKLVNIYHIESILKFEFIRAQQRALAAVMALSRLHRVLRRRPAPASIHLDHVLAAVNGHPSLDSLGLARAKGRTQSRSKLTQASIFYLR